MSGTGALGGNGGALAYGDITTSVAVLLNINSSTGGGPSTYLVATNGQGNGAGYFPTYYQSTVPVNLDSGHPIAVTVEYLNSNLNLTLADTVSGAVYVTNCEINIPGFVGGTNALVGFTGADNTTTSYQTISDFMYYWPLNSISLSTNQLLEPPASGSDSVTLTLSPSSVPWSATVNVPWLHLDETNGAGSATVGFSFDAYIPTSSNDLPRTGVLTIAGQGVIVNQASASYSVATNVFYEPPFAGSDEVSLTVSPSIGSWTATANLPWLHLAETSGTGSATIGFTFDANTAVNTALRSGTLTIAGQTVAITQASVVAFTNATNVPFLAGAANSFTFTVSGGPAPTFSTSSPLPSDVSLSPSGVLSGTPPEGSEGNYPLTIVASNGLSPNATQNFTLQVIDSSTLQSSPITFNTDGLGWALNGSPTSTPITDNVFTPTDGTLEEARSVWFEYPVYVGSFLASFTYQDARANGADGVAFVIQNSPSGTSALGGDGGYLGYEGITNSVAVLLDIYSGATGGPSGFLVATNGWGEGAGYSSPYYQSTAPVNLDSGDPIAVTVGYLSNVLNVTFADTVTGSVYQTNFAVNIAAFVGGTNAFVGFTGGDGGIASQQTISDFTYSWPLTALNLSTNRLDEPVTVGSDSVTLSVNPASVVWTATAYAPWLHLTVTNGTGSAAVPFTFDSDVGFSPRVGQITIAGQQVTIVQGPQVVVTNLLEGSAAGVETVPVFLLNYFPAQASPIANASWLHISPTNAYTSPGNTNVAFTFDANTAPTPRTGALTIQGATVTVTQAGANYAAAGVVPLIDLTPFTNSADMQNGYFPEPYPGGFALDASGNLYIAMYSPDAQGIIGPGDVIGSFDNSHGMVLKWTPTNSLSILASNYFPTIVGVDTSGNVYFNDQARLTQFLSGRPPAAM